MKDPLKPRDKITQKMTRDGLIEVNETKETAERVSRREQEADFSKPQEQPAPQAAQEAAAQNVAELPPVSPDASPLPLAPELPPQAGHRYRRARHGARWRSPDPESE